MEIIRKIRWWWFHKRLYWVARFIEKHKLYPVKIDKHLLEIWKKHGK